MHEHRFHGDLARLRSPERLSWLEVERVVRLSTATGGIHSVLDVGTGTGVFAEAFAAAGLAVEGLDANPDMLAAAREQVPAVPFREGIAESLPYPPASFDLVFMGLLFHETDDHLLAIREAARVARTRVAILEWPYQLQEIGPGLDERLTEQQITSFASQAGLVAKDIVHLKALVLYLFDK